jgi:hypothetical protein
MVQNYTAISTHAIDYDRPVSSGKITKRVKGVDRERAIIFFPAGIAKAQEAVNNVLEKYNADLLI